MPDYVYITSLVGYIMGTALFIALFFTSVANYLLDRRPTRIIECMMCVILGLISFVRSIGTVRPPYINTPTVVTSTAILWLIFILLSIIWSVILARAKWKSIKMTQSVKQIVHEIEKASEKDA